MKHYIPVVFWALVILVLSITPSSELPETDIKLADKIAHVVVYGILSFLLLRNYLKHQLTERSGLKVWLLFLVLTFFYGILMEVLQACCVESRFGEWQDALANCIGAIFGLIVGNVRWKAGSR